MAINFIKIFNLSFNGYSCEATVIDSQSVQTSVNDTQNLS